MATSISSNKRIRQNEKRRIRNRALSSAYKTTMKRLLQAVEKGDRAAAEAALNEALARIDKAAKSSVLHKNSAARKKSQVMRAVARLAKKA
ncbi:MAG: 30S ribosomal protein S20 [Planctomycetes bacterium]|nr:30S ribosomal protein S20 [Planctomycetota bacterium]